MLRTRAGCCAQPGRGGRQPGGRAHRPRHAAQAGGWVGGWVGPRCSLPALCLPCLAEGKRVATPRHSFREWPARAYRAPWGGSCQCHSQHPQRSSRAGGAARSAPGVAAHYSHTRSPLLHTLRACRRPGGRHRLLRARAGAAAAPPRRAVQYGGGAHRGGPDGPRHLHVRGRGAVGGGCLLGMLGRACCAALGRAGLGRRGGRWQLRPYQA